MTGVTRFEYEPPTILHGANSVSSLDSELDRLDDERVMIITSGTVGRTTDVMQPVTSTLGDRLVATFDEVTPAKTLGTAAAAARRGTEAQVDALIALGGGASLDNAKLVSLLCAHDEPTTDVATSMVKRGSVSVPETGAFLDIFAIPTTLPGADLSQAAGVGLTMDTAVESGADVPGGGVSDARLMPAAVCYDPTIVATTPADILARSAMNGYDKGLEAIYSRYHTPVTDATATRGLALLQSSLPAIMDEGTSVASLSRILEGIALVQYGLSSPEMYRASIIHAFGHALTDAYRMQQGVAHAIAAPHVLSYLFEQVDARRELLASAVDVDPDPDPADGVVDTVTETRDALGLPSSLRTVDGADPADAPALATAVLGDSFMGAVPRGLEPTHGELVNVFESMW